jgi:hypothetical protein
MAGTQKPARAASWRPTGHRAAVAGLLGRRLPGSGGTTGGGRPGRPAPRVPDAHRSRVQGEDGLAVGTYAGSRPTRLRPGARGGGQAAGGSGPRTGPARGACRECARAGRGAAGHADRSAGGLGLPRGRRMGPRRRLPHRRQARPPRERMDRRSDILASGGAGSRPTGADRGHRGPAVPAGPGRSAPTVRPVERPGQGVPRACRPRSRARPEVEDWGPLEHGLRELALSRWDALTPEWRALLKPNSEQVRPVLDSMASLQEMGVER